MYIIYKPDVCGRAQRISGPGERSKDSRVSLADSRLRSPELSPFVAELANPVVAAFQMHQYTYS